MDVQFEMEWRELLGRLSAWAEQPVDLQGALFLVGVQELGLGWRNFKKDEKVGLMHVAICTLLMPYGYYELVGRDEDGWPHFERAQSLPNLESGQQEKLMKEALVEYFRDYSFSRA